MATVSLKEQYKSLQEENDQYEKLISLQKDQLVSLEREITVSENSIQEKLTVPGGLFKLKGKQSRLWKHIRTLENDLNQYTIRFDRLMSRNVDLRKDIAHLLQQKGLWCNVAKKFNKQLATQLNQTEKMEESFTVAFQQRSEAEGRMLEVGEWIEVETAHFTKRRMKLKTNIDHDAKLQTFMETKLQEVICFEENEDSKNRKKQLQDESGVEKLEMYRQGHSSLVEVTQESDLREIAHMFAQNDQKNFARISYINQLQNKRNMLRHSTDKMKSDILFLEEENKGHDEHINSTLKDLESELEKNRCLSDSLEQRCADVQTTLGELTGAISGLLDHIMPEAVTVNLDNVVHFISILEESISGLLMQANNMEEEQMDPLSMLLANFELLPGNEVVVETERGKSPARSLKSA
ncbi:coiled-coil domain-containing protein 63-like isoform X2 [Trematomus bernacchii]|uniref:coiled-coil domain-containing protein 63-like isoform X2 n=1 Tax=Trematomus bernacchii TaxID=40690 RepID=UPI00146C7377|nr:coiled-coil domain-containing protein 63-like isoform X2 [Trematomus bernacchii]